VIVEVINSGGEVIVCVVVCPARVDIIVVTPPASVMVCVVKETWPGGAPTVIVSTIVTTDVIKLGGSVTVDVIVCPLIVVNTVDREPGAVTVVVVKWVVIGGAGGGGGGPGT
jgi:hypothetical protein